MLLFLCVLGAIAFGVWQGSIGATVFMFVVLLFVVEFLYMERQK
jgi:hypothetical protein